MPDGGGFFPVKRGFMGCITALALCSLRLLFLCSSASLRAKYNL